MPRHQMRNPRKPRKYSSDAYLIGFDTGYNLIKDLWQGFGETPMMSLDRIVEDAYEIESNSRQYAGHPIYDFRIEQQWDDYDKGFDAGIEQFVMETTL